MFHEDKYVTSKFLLNSRREGRSHGLHGYSRI